MKRFLISLIILLPGLLAAQTTVHRNPGESDADFALRMRPNSKSVFPKTNPVLHGKYGFLTDKEEIIAVYNDTVTMEAYVYLFIPDSTKDDYRKIAVDTLSPGLFDWPNLISVFFANADKDKDSELFIIYSIGTRYPSGDGYGYGQYRLFSMYDNETDSNGKLKPMNTDQLNEDISKTLGGKAYTAKDLKNILKKEGY